MSAPVRTFTPAEAADLLGVAPARVRALVTSGALTTAPGAPAGTVAATDVEELQRRGVVRAVDIAAVEGALDRALRRRLPDLLDEQLSTALHPVARELATALADAEASGAAVARAEARMSVAEDAVTAARERIAELEQQVAALEARPVGLFRRRRTTVAHA